MVGEEEKKIRSNPAPISPATLSVMEMNWLRCFVDTVSSAVAVMGRLLGNGHN
jgi:hypothetical protein